MRPISSSSATRRVFAAGARAAGIERRRRIPRRTSTTDGSRSGKPAVRRPRESRSRAHQARRGDAHRRRVRAGELPHRAQARRRGPRRCRLLHAVQQGRDAQRASGLRRRDRLLAAKCSARRAPRANSTSSTKLWNARVTSHVPLSAVASLHDASTRSSTRSSLTDRSMRDADFASPRIAVAGLNPHAGDGGNFGREEIDVIAPAVEAARRAGVNVEGPFPPTRCSSARTNGQFRRRGDDVSRPGPDRDEADGL